MVAGPVWRMLASSCGGDGGHKTTARDPASTMAAPSSTVRGSGMSKLTRTFKAAVHTGVPTDAVHGLSSVVVSRVEAE